MGPLLSMVKVERKGICWLNRSCPKVQEELWSIFGALVLARNQVNAFKGRVILPSLGLEWRP